MSQSQLFSKLHQIFFNHLESSSFIADETHQLGFISFSVDRKERILLNMYLRISLRNFEEFSGSPKTAKMPHILTNWRFQRNWIDLERENHPHVLTDENLSNSAKFRIHLQSLDYYRWVFGSIATFFKIASDFFGWCNVADSLII